MDFLNFITYGNPSIQQKETLEKKTIVMDLFKELSKNEYPSNDSEEVRNELEEIVQSMKDLDNDENAPYLVRYINYDKGLITLLIKTLSEIGVKEEMTIRSIYDDISPLILKLKYKYQRPRPYQLAQYYKIKLFPLKSNSVGSPSFPSGHTIQSQVILGVLGQKYPKYYSQFKKMAEDIGYSRIYLGHHFPSDNDFGHLVAQRILEHPEFVKKYGI